MEFTTRLIPLMRECIEVVKMIMFKRLREHLELNHPERDGIFLSRLTGAVVNELFGTPNDQEPFASFILENRGLISAELKVLGQTLPEMRIPLTDALRMQTLCDLQEGNDSSSLLDQARELDLLLSDRDLPLPHTFMDMVRKLGAAFGLILPTFPSEDSPGAAAN
jgi:hypothetical protein